MNIKIINNIYYITSNMDDKLFTILILLYSSKSFCDVVPIVTPIKSICPFYAASASIYLSSTYNTYSLLQLK